MKPMYKKGGKSPKKMRESWMEEKEEIHFGDKPKKMQTAGPKKEIATGRTGYMRALPDSLKPNIPPSPFNVSKEDALKKLDEFRKKEQKGETKGTMMLPSSIRKQKTGGKSMEPGGGGRFAAMVSGLKKKGKSEESAKAIAASIGRKKYGKSRFQEMAAAGKKKMGGKKC